MSGSTLEELTPATSIAGSELVYIVQGGADKSATVGQLGGAKLLTTGVVANGLLGQLPANGFILYAMLRETAGHAVNVAVGSTSGGTDVATAVAVPAHGTVLITAAAFSLIWFSASATQNLYLSSASWGSASINCQLSYQVGP